VFGEKDQALRVRIRQRPHQNRVRNGEDRRRRSDAEHEHRERRDREAGGAPQQPRAVSQVAPDRVEPGRAHGTGGFDRLRESPEIAEREAACLPGRNAARPVRFHLAFQVIAKFLRDLAVDLAPAQQPTHRGEKTSDHRPSRSRRRLQAAATSRDPRGV
jgi:hypothetical protein